MLVHINENFDLMLTYFHNFVEVFTTASGGIIYVPRISTSFEIFVDALKNLEFFQGDFASAFQMIELEIELFLWNRTIESLDYIYPALIREALFFLEQNKGAAMYEPSRGVISFFHIYFMVMFFLLGASYIMSYGIRNSAKAATLKEGGWAVYMYLDEIEEECGQIEDGFIYLAYFLAFVLWFYLFNLFFSSIISKHLTWLLVLFCFVLCLGAIIPTSLLNWLGAAFGQFIRGSSRSTNLFFETLLDFVSVSVIIIRFFVQNVRFVFIFVAFFELYENIIATQPLLSKIISPHITWEGFLAGEYRNFYAIELLILAIYQGILYFYYVAHLTLTYIAQLAIFIILSFWIFFFLYTTFTLPSKDKFFYYKRFALLEK